jgi:hypothetical protein
VVSERAHVCGLSHGATREKETHMPSSGTLPAM